MPKLSAIANYWAGLPLIVREDLFPHWHGIGPTWDVPFCFRCGWMPPVREASEYARLGWIKAEAKAWDSASGWLEKAHLQEHSLNGTEVVENLVPLCVLCHEEQPRGATRAEGLEFVCSPSLPYVIRLLSQTYTDAHYTGTRAGGHSGALRAMLRARATAGVALAQDPLRL